MKKTIIIALAMLLSVASASARPALKGVSKIMQPDGTEVSIRLIGDEWRHYNTTADGYALVKNDQGFYVYAQLSDNGQLTPTSLIAHDEGMRSNEELAYIQQTGRIAPKIGAQMAKMREQVAQGRRKALAANRARYDYDNFKGLVLLIEYNDCSFRYEDYHDIMEEMINQENYTGNDRTNYRNPSTNKMVNCVGSMHDYFRDNSNGIFSPTFDVVGPIKVDRSMYYTDVDKESDPDRKGYLSIQLMIDACAAADPEVDFSQYDRDGDGEVDMIYFVFAGMSSYIQGNDPRLLWPHQAEMTWLRKVRRDGVILGRYACSTELFGYESSGWSVLEGIGTMCHEFSHVLGLPDFYDTDNEYEDQLCVSPGTWSLMDSGYDESGRCPVGYSLFERYALGFATPQLITTPGTLWMQSVDQSNTGYRLDTPQDNEFFMLENRQHNKWDAQLPSHGMLVWRVDSTNTYMWQANAVNDNPNHPYYELVRAGGTHKNAYGYMASSADPFPGSNNVTRLDNLTTPANLRSWAGKNCLLGLNNIQEKNGYITFEVFDANVLTFISLPEEAMVGVGTSLQLVTERIPDYAPYTAVWSSDNEAVVSVNEEGVITGNSVGTAVVTVVANDSLTASCTVTVRDLPVVADIAAFKALDDNGEALLTLTNAQVLYAYSNKIYLRDASGTIVLSGTGLKLAKNDILNGAIYGRKTIDNRMPTLNGVKELTTSSSFYISQGEEAQPVSLHISQLDANYYSDLVTINKAQLVSDGGMFAVLGDKRYRLYNTFKISGIKVPTDLTKRYNITAIFGTNTLNGEVIDELYLLKSPTNASYKALTSISIPSEMQLPVGRIYQIEPECTPAQADMFLVWTSSNEQVATVTQEGLLTTLSNGITTITVTNLDNGLSAQCELTVGERVVKQDIADFKMLDEGQEAQLTLTDALVTFIYKNDVYLRDASGAIRLASTGLNLKAGDMLNGHIYGRYAISDGVPELRPIAGSTNADGYSVISGQSIEPRGVKVGEITANDYADLIILREVQLTSVEGLAGVYVSDGTHHVRIYNSFGLKNPIQTPYEGKAFNLTGILTTAKVGNQTVDNLGLTEKAEEVQIPDGIAHHASPSTILHQPSSIYTPDGRLVGKGFAATIQQMNLPQGVYILKSDSRSIKVVIP